MKFLANPVVLQGAVVLFCSTFAFMLGLIVMRRLRQSIQEEADISEEAPAFEALPLHVYNTVIRQLKQQQDELKAQSQAELERSRGAEQFTDAVLANLRCGVLGIGKNGLVKSSNRAAKQILGFASPVGMSVKDIFRAATVCPDAETAPEADAVLVSEMFNQLSQQSGTTNELQVQYRTPGGEERSLAITVAPVISNDGIGGTAWLISDVTELNGLRRELLQQHSTENSRSASAGA